MPPFAVHRDLTSSCSQYYAIGDEVGVPPLYIENDAGCIAIVPPDGLRWFTTGTVQPAAALTRQRDMSAQRLHTITRVRLVAG